MTQIHPETRPETSGSEGQPAQPAQPVPPQPVPPQPYQGQPQPYQGQPQPYQGQPQQPQHTAPVWFGETRELPREHAAFGIPSGGAPSAYPPVFQTPAGPPPPSVPTRHGAEPAQPANRHRWLELTAVAALAAVLASGGTYAASQLADTSQPISAANSATLGRGTNQAPVVQADPNNPNWTATAAAVAPSVVSIKVVSGQSEAEGSGVIIDSKGHILTNNHVVAGAGQGAQLTVTLNDGRAYKATVAGTDPSTDLAVITLTNPPKDLKPVALGNSDDIKVGDPVMAIGNPLGLAGTVTTGIVSALNRPVTTQAEEQQPQQPTDPFGQGQQGNQGNQGNQGQGSDSSQVVTNAIQTSAAINPGNSGGALVNAAGQLIGINSSIATLGSSGSSQSGSIGIGFAIPVNEAKSIAQQLISKGSAQHAFLGVSLQDAMASDGTSQRAGAQVAAVTSGTPAAAAGLKKGDVIVAVNGERVDSTLSLVGNIRERSVGDKVALTVLRDGKELKLTATLVAKASPTQ
jgi:putative serine protease PepD